MNDQRLALLIERVQPRHGGVQRKERIERQRRLLPGGPEGEVTAEGSIVLVADRRHHGEAVHRAAQDHRDETRLASGRRPGGFGQIGPGDEGTGPGEEHPPRRAEQRVRD